MSSFTVKTFSEAKIIPVPKNRKKVKRKMLKAYKYRIYPSQAQKEFFEKTFGSCRFVWNKMLEEKLDALRKGKKSQE